MKQTIKKEVKEVIIRNGSDLQFLNNYSSVIAKLKDFQEIEVLDYSVAKYRTTKNQKVYVFKNGKVFASHNDIVAMKLQNGKKQETYIFPRAFDFKTTARFRIAFLEEKTAISKAKLENGEYNLLDLKACKQLV